MKTLGVIGCGLRSDYVVRNIPGLGADVVITALCDTNAEAARRFGDQYAPEATFYEDYGDLVAQPDLDWVLIGSWNCHHREHAVAALEAGKDIFCEKPLATTVEDCLAIRDAVRRSGRKFIVGFTLRYSPHYRKIRELLDSGKVGDIVSLEFNETIHYEHGGFIHGDWRRLERLAGSHLLEKCCHDIDILHWMVGDLPARVASFGGTNFFNPDHAHQKNRIGSNAEGREAYSAWARPKDYDPFGADKDIVDNQVAILEFPGGQRATFHTNCNTIIPERRMYICGTEGTLRADLIKGDIEVQRIGRETTLEHFNMCEGDGHGGGDEVLGRELVDSMLRDAQSRTTVDDGLYSAFTCFGIDEARATGQVVDMAKYWDQAR